MELFASVEFTPMFAASIESIVVFLVIAAVTAVFNAMKKKDGATDDWTPREPPPRIPSRESSRPYVPPAGARNQVDWEKELRDLLQAAAPVPPPQRRPVPPPVTPPRRSPYVPPPQPRSQPTRTSPPVPRQEKFYKGHCTHCGGPLEFRAKDMEETISCPHCHEPTVLRPFEQRPSEAPSPRKAVSSVGAGAKTWQDASGMDRRVGSEMAETLRRPVVASEVTRLAHRSAEVQNVVSLLRTPQTARQAMIASFILSPPKAFES